jgi:uncharacterized protein (TIGR02453 family)
MAFQGWPVEAVRFFEGLEADNSRAYWSAHRATYDRSVKGPMEALLADLAAEFGEGSLFRPNRDTRFSRDKSPYKLECAAHLPRGYLSFSADGVLVGTGLYMPSPAHLQRYRAAVDDERTGPELEAIVRDLRAGGYDVGGHESLKTAPRGYPKDHPRVELLRQKGIVMSRTWPIEEVVGNAGLRDGVVTCLRDARPLQAWVDRATA